MKRDCNLVLYIGFFCIFSSTGWTVSSTDIYYFDFVDSLVKSGKLFMGVHRGTTDNTSPVSIKTPPQTPVKLLTYYTHKPFNLRQYAICLSQSRMQAYRKVQYAPIDRRSVPVRGILVPPQGNREQRPHHDGRRFPILPSRENKD